MHATRDGNGAIEVQATAAPVLELTDICKSFGGVAALRGVNLTVRSGRIHALLGMNGAGKSTLVQAICGGEEPDSGVMLVGGEPARNLTPRRARALGIRTVHQKRTLIPELSVAENLLLGVLPGRGGIVDWKETRVVAGQALEAIGVELPLDTPASELSIGAQTLLEIAREVRLGGRILILDEPTAALGGADAEAVHRVVRAVAARGLAIIYISHHLDEVMDLADDVTVLRDGREVLSEQTSSLDVAAVVRAMAGGEAVIERMPRVAHTGGAEVLRLENLSVEPVLASLSLSVAAGEIVAVLGAAGGGQSKLFSALSGYSRSASGLVSVGGRRIDFGRVGSVLDAGLRCVPADRLGLGLVPALGVDENITALARRGQRSLLQHWGRTRARAQQIRQEFAVVTLHRDPPVERLSGGNQQKVLLGKWMSGESPAACLLEEPTAGVDVMAKVEIHKLIDRIASRGTAILLASSDVDEVLRIADRAIVVRDGVAVAEVVVESSSREELMGLVLGGESS